MHDAGCNPECHHIGIIEASDEAVYLVRLIWDGDDLRIAAFETAYAAAITELDEAA